MNCLEPTPNTKIGMASDNESHRIVIDSKIEPLSKDFQPGDKDVIVGRGKKCYNHVGNKELRRIVVSKLDEYSNTSCKNDKSYILSAIVAIVRESGGFVKQDSKTGQWYDVGDLLAREKISQTFRDALHEKYKSSTAFKRKRRQEKRAKAASFFCNNIGNFHRSQLPFPIIIPQRIEAVQQNNEQVDWRENSLFSQSLTMLDLESASEEPINIVEQLSFSHPNRRIETSQQNNEQVYWRNDSLLSQSLTMLDLESASDEPINVVERLSSSLPNLSFQDDDPLEPIPIPNAFMEENKLHKENDCFEPIRLLNNPNDNNDCSELAKLFETDSKNQEFSSLRFPELNIPRAA